VLRYVPALLSLALTVYCVIDAFQTDQADMRNLPKVAWLMLVVLLPVVGPVAWLLLGRPRRGTPPSQGQQQRWQDDQRNRDRRPRGPDDDPDFLKGI
jgi:hypothetical protein